MAITPIELKPIECLPGSINELVSPSKKFKRPPSLSESFAWTPENVERAYRVSLLLENEKTEEIIFSNISSNDISSDVETLTIYEKVAKKIIIIEKHVIAIIVKLLLHITLISIFETVFFFLYVSTLENAGIEKTVNTFINGAVNGCTNLTTFEVMILNDFLTPFVNVTKIIKNGNDEMRSRELFNNKIVAQAWTYVGVLSGLFVILLVYIQIRKIKIVWRSIILENLAMVFLLALYEFMFFETIIYPYQPLTASEIGRNAIEELENSCGLFINLTSITGIGS